MPIVPTSGQSRRKPSTPWTKTSCSRICYSAILINLVGNGLKFTEKGEVVIDIASERVNFTSSCTMLKDRHILIVDDTELNRRILFLQAERRGMISHSFEKPKDALAWLENTHPIDMAVLDLQMPDFDGCRLAREIHALDHCKNLRSSLSHTRVAGSVPFAAQTRKG
jgi:CheY-like chemotaxis protein